VKSSSRRVGSPKPPKVKLNKGRKEVLRAQQLQRERMASTYLPSLPVRYIYHPHPAVLSFQERQDLLNLTENDVDMGFTGEGDSWEDIDDADMMLAVPPPGEEGFFLSHASGEATLQQIFVDSMSKR